jgi:putative nucleotidyltransferase with HDIG domain
VKAIKVKAIRGEKGSMRYVSIDKIKVGSIIADDILNEGGSLLLKKESQFKEAYRKKLKELGITYVLIDDEISKGITPTRLLTPVQRQALEEDIKNEFETLINRMEVDYTSMRAITSVITEKIKSVEAFYEMVDLKLNDQDTYAHCISVAIMAGFACRRLYLNEEITEKVVMGALFHDIGKTIIPKDILNKPSQLTKEEFDIIKTHPELGYEMIKEYNEFPPLSKVIVLCHHEREDGSGYPLGKGAEVHLGVKIVAACDVFHALLSDRPYRQGLSIEEVIEIARKEKLNQEVVSAIEATLVKYPVGSIVELSNGEIGIVKENFYQDLERPEVRIIFSNGKYKMGHRVNLQEEKEIYIAKNLDYIPEVDE